MNDDRQGKTHSNGLNSTALIKDVIHKSAHEKAKVSSTMTADFSQKSNIKISTSVRASTKSMDENNYTYDSAIENYKTRIAKTINTRVYGENDNRESVAAKLDLPKVDISKRREMFEKDSSSMNGAPNKMPIGEEIVSIKDRISSLKNSNLQTSTTTTNNGGISNSGKIDMQTTTKLKDRLSSLQSSISAEKPQDAETISKIDLENRQMENPAGLVSIEDNESLDTDHEDSGIHTTDVSCSVSQSDEQQEPQIDEYQVMQSAHEESPVSIDSSEVQDHEPEQIDEESVSDQDEEPMSPQTVLEGKLIFNISGDRSNEKKEVKSTNKKPVDCNLLEKNFVAERVKRFSNPTANNVFTFIRSNLIRNEDDENFDEDSVGYNDNNYVYECIKINKKNNTMKCNALEKSNSVDTAMSLCSSSEIESLVEDNEK